jgi:hypothetical protein
MLLGDCSRIQAQKCVRAVGVRGGGTLGNKESAPTPNPSPHSQRKRAARGGGEHGESAAPFHPYAIALPLKGGG